MALRKFYSRIILQSSFCSLRSIPCCYMSNAKLDDKDDNYTHFGFETVKKEDKAKRVHGVFSSVAANYDLMNDVMSMGIHRLWKDHLIRAVNPTEKTVLLDCAGGTGDVAFRFIQYVKDNSASAITPDVTVCDINSDMLDVGKKRAEEKGLDLKWVCGSADDLPFDDASFNAYTIAFGIRNCTDINKVLKEAYRVLLPGGRFTCLEFSEVSNPVLRSLYDSYSFQVLPVMGEVIAGDWKSYQYLSESIRKFPTQNDFARMIKDTGFKEVSFKNLTFGVCAIHTGFKL